MRSATRPATAPQPSFDTRIVEGYVEVRLRRDDGEEPAGNGRTDR
ncbi:hypothetical protein [Streptomyces europaeiscabiei]|nr:hypothetical protein [Streptomyces europaeiscabiei]